MTFWGSIADGTILKAYMADAPSPMTGGQPCPPGPAWR